MPKKNLKRGERLYKIKTLKKSRAVYWGANSPAAGFEMTDRQKGIVANTPKPCGCRKCSKPRKHFGKSFSDLRQEILLV